VPAEQQQEALTLRLNLAITSRELGLLKDALIQFQDVLVRMSVTTPLRYIAETHWELALVIFEQANSQELEQHNHANTLEMQQALQHAETASNLYGSIGETLRASLLQCQIALIEQASGNLDGARKRLQDVLATWEPTLEASEDCPLVQRYTLKERANVASAAACYLAGIELEAKNYEQAQQYVQQAIQAANQSYILRRAEAKMTLGRILEATNQNAEAEKAFREAIEELAPTERIAAKIRAHDLLGRHLLKKGETEQGERELDVVRKLSRLPATFNSETSSETTPEDNESSK
jgi:tetratricopeptide (TPR) repeat protein